MTTGSSAPHRSLLPPLSAPVRVEIPAAVRRVAVVTPCYNRPGDAAAVLADFGALPETARAGLRMLLVDNASDRPLSHLATPEGVHLEHLRLSSNTGGSGGYNAGLRRVLGLDAAPRAADPSDWRGFDPEFVWLVDSDARVAPSTLAALIEAMDADPTIVMAGASIADPETGLVFEVGGAVHRRTGNFGPRAMGAAALPATIDCDYVAACCALVRASGLRAAASKGLATFPDRFLNGDDVEWCIRLSHHTGGRVVAATRAIAMHPKFDRFPVFPRYYMARNAFGPIDALGLGGRVKFHRSLRESARAMQQAAMGRHDLARLHRLGLRHAAAGRTTGAAPPDLTCEAFHPFESLAEQLENALPRLGRAAIRVVVHPELDIPRAARSRIIEQLKAARLADIREPAPGSRRSGGLVSGARAMLRLLPLPRARIAVLPARGRPETWWRARVAVLVTPQGFVIRRARPLRDAAAAALTGASCLMSSARIALRAPHQPARPGTPVGPASSPPAAAGSNQTKTAPAVSSAHAPAHTERKSLTLDVVLLSHNREAPLRATIRSLIEEHGVAPTSIILADNASTAFDPGAVARDFPGLRLLRMDANIGVEAFNRGAAASDADALLILDDDATPAPGALAGAMDLLSRRDDLAAVTLHPRHARTRAVEWPFAAALNGSPSDAWPVMGCANFVRRADWLAVGGYDPRWFLYRNDADLALKLLASGRGVYFNPDWFAEHDSPAAPGAPKSPRWHRLATRNWMWLARRHGRGLGTGGLAAAALGWLHAHRLAGASPVRHAATLAGALDGLLAPPPQLQRALRAKLDATPAEDRPFTRLMRLKLG